MDYKKIYRIFGAIVFLISAVVFTATAQPSVSFWDCGEFISSAYFLQVPHPPGTPLFLIIGKFFSMIPFAENIAFRVNMVSALSSAFTVLFLYLIAVKLIENYRKEYKGMVDALSTYIAAAVGALSLSFSDTFWFNAVEAEVYALATFFIAFVVWVLMLWNEKADEEGNERYIIFMAYLIGLSTGVHLMSVLAMVPIVMTIMYRKFLVDNDELKTTGYILIGHAAIVLAIAMIMWASQTGGVPNSKEYKDFDMKMVTVLGAVSLIYMGIFYKKIFTRNSIYLPVIFGGIALFVTYPGIVKQIPNLITMLSGDDFLMNFVVFAAILAAIVYGLVWTKNNGKKTIMLALQCLLVAIIGYSSYAMILVRSNMDTPINLNSPKTMPELNEYLDRKQYGDFPLLKRRYTQEPHQSVVYREYSSDLDFWWRYQMNHMFNRYLLWNYAGRVSTVQDSGVDWSQLFGIPFLLGLLGLYFHFRKDWKMASVFLMMFIFLGYLTAFYQNQQQPQPRERDYFYVGAFFVYSIWIALGVRGIIDLFFDDEKLAKFRKPAITAVLGLAIIFVPVRMLAVNYFTHDRSENYVPWDYAYNMLQSVAPNAIIFTNGDNDTFPLWYMQDVEGVRRDVRIANLSLINTPWYIKQLKNTAPFGSQKIKMKLTDGQIDRIQPIRFEPKQMSLPLTQKAIEEFGIKDTALINAGKITWLMKNTVEWSGIKALRVQDIVVQSIIEANNWERPIYFAVTCASDSRIGLDDYLEMEGMAYRLVPVKHPRNLENVNPEIMSKQLLEEPEGYSRNYQPGFKFRGLNSKDIFFNANHRRLTQNYRTAFMRLALYYMKNTKEDEKAWNVLQKMEEKMPRDVIPAPYEILYQLSTMYWEIAPKEEYKKIAEDLEPLALARLERNPRDVSSYFNPYRVLFEIYDNLEEYTKALDVAYKLKKIVPNDRQVDMIIDRYKGLIEKKNQEK